MTTPYDARFKLLAEEHPALLLRLLGILKPGAKSEPVHLLRELQSAPVQLDHAYLIGEGKDARVIHFEAITSWRNSRITRLALYRFLLREIYKLPISSYALLLAKKYEPPELPERIVYEDGDGLRVETRYTVIRLWEIDPEVAFEPGNEALLPWAPLLKGGTAEFQRAVAAVERLADHPEQAPYAVSAMVSNLATLATLRYDKDEISQLLKRLQERLMLSSEIFADSWLYKDGVAEGKAEGEALGLINGKRSIIALVLANRFPNEAFPPLDAISAPDDLDRVFFAVNQAATAEAARAAIQSALRVQ